MTEKHPVIFWYLGFFLLFSLLCVIFLMIVLHIWFNKRETKRKKLKEELQDFMRDKVVLAKVFTYEEIPDHLKSIWILLPVLELFSMELSDPTWLDSRNRILKEHLFPQLKPGLKSRSWTKVLQSLRCIALIPNQLMDEELVIPLLRHKQFLVRILAAKCMVLSGRPHLLYPVIEEMKRTPELSRYPYRDLLVQGGALVYNELKRALDQEVDPETAGIYLDILSTHMTTDLVAYAKRYVESPNLQVRHAAIAIFSNFPGEESIQELVMLLDDPASSVRAEALAGLRRTHAVGKIDKIAKKLDDRDWRVRFQAGLALKSFGNQGLAVLYHVARDENSLSYEMAKYVMFVPEKTL